MLGTLALLRLIIFMIFALISMCLLAGTFRRANLPLVVNGNVSMNEVRRIMGEIALLRQIQQPPMKYVLCQSSSLAVMIAKIRALENVQGVKCATLSQDQEELASTDLRHSLIREEIRKFYENEKSNIIWDVCADCKLSSKLSNH